jgi:glycosyltransferase involved in cell wall biosynthesis
MFTNVFLPHVGGVSHSVQRLARGLRQLGHHVTVVAPEWDGRPLDETDVVRVPAIQNVTDMDFALPLPVPRHVAQAVKKVQPDLVHSHHPHLLGSMALRVTAEHQLPLVFTYHTRYECYVHYVYSESAALGAFAARLGSGYCQLAEQVIAPSESTRQLLEERGVKTPIATIPTGVDLHEYADGDGAAARSRFGIPRDSFLCGTVSRLGPEKNLLFLSRSVSRFLQDHGGAHFLAVGYGPSRQEMEATFADRGVLNRCHFAGKTTGRDLVNAYHAMDAFVFASTTETQGMVVVEALAAGCPVIALDAPGAREAVQDGRNGRLVHDQDEDVFADGLAWLAKRNREAAHLLSEQAVQSARTFDVDRCVDKVQKLYERVLERRHPGLPGTTGAWSGALRGLQRDWAIWGNRFAALVAALRADGEEQEPTDVPVP